MNSFAASSAFVGTGFVALYRLAHHAKHRPVLDERGEVIRYPTAADARIAAFEALLSELNGKEAYWIGGRVLSAREKAEIELQKVMLDGEGRAKTKAGCEAPAERTGGSSPG